MKFHETKFEEYINSCNKRDLHPELDEIKNIDRNAFNNIIFYGPPGVGKYTQTLKFLKQYSDSGLKYERKINMNYQKKYHYTFKISDIHYEIDMELLGCNAKMLWNEIYKSILDIVSSKTKKIGFIVCKNFHKIHSELLDIFYSYMQSLTHKNISISFIIVSESVSFIPDNILKRCKVIPIKRPTKTKYKYALRKTSINNIDITKLNNIKDIIAGNANVFNENKKIVNSVINYIEHYKNINYYDFRDMLYNIFIYHLDLNECIWEIIDYFVQKNMINGEKMYKINKFMYEFLVKYNNNYRPIYHLERFVLYLCRIVHEF